MLSLCLLCRGLLWFARLIMTEMTDIAFDTSSARSLLYHQEH